MEEENNPLQDELEETIEETANEALNRLDTSTPEGIEGINSEDDPPTEGATATPNIAKPQLNIPKVELPPEAQIVEIPFTDIEVPMPTTTIMTTAATTAAISVGATLTATSLFKYIVMVLKPIMKQAWNKITKRKQDLSNSSSSAGQQDS